MPSIPSIEPLPPISLAKVEGADAQSVTDVREEEPGTLWFTPDGSRIERMERRGHPSCWTYGGALLQGKSHRERHVPCDDYALALHLPNGVLIAVVCDGAGSAKSSREGSRCAAEHFVEHVARRMDECKSLDELAREGAAAARSGVEKMATRWDRQSAEFATTIIGAICTLDQTAVVQLGDGCAVLWDAEGVLSMPTLPMKGEFANSTYFLTNDHWDRSIQVALAPACEFLAIFSDGLASLIVGDGNVPHLPFFERLRDNVRKAGNGSGIEEDIASLYRSPSVRERITDDATLVVALRMNEPTSPTQYVSEVGE